ncbi:mannose-6-phosphate isomerase-like protein (cupin superfamily) [Scopulibacillus daqui]|uniref:Mannose-6-phosphate isomerase-like protein (Cupin superfamily) n=1 Tax=Scopulibacillus daqui TaxID=1469162 RepID=A0ABS2Q0V0_9BACL|nr:mannose-6-phosphate isomerase-like protein (cupin superfamily) [Scopulibacillus daqui]
MQIKDFSMDRQLKEQTPHRTSILPVACYETTIREHIRGYIPLHWHDEFQFVLVCTGSAIFQMNEEKQIVHSGEGLFINSGCLHMAKDAHKSRCTYLCLNVSPPFRIGT